MSYPNEFAAHFLGVGGVVIHDQKVLLVKLLYGRAQGRWLVPGGFVEKGETLREAVIRELKEETSADIEPMGIVGVRSMVRNTDGLTDVYSVFKCTLRSDPDAIFPQPGEIAEVGWFDLDELSKHDDIPEYTQVLVRQAYDKQPLQLDGPLNEQARQRFHLEKYEQYWVP